MFNGTGDYTVGEEGRGGMRKKLQGEGRSRLSRAFLGRIAAGLRTSTRVPPALVCRGDCLFCAFITSDVHSLEKLHFKTSILCPSIAQRTLHLLQSDTRGRPATPDPCMAATVRLAGHRPVPAAKHQSSQHPTPQIAPRRWPRPPSASPPSTGPP